MEIDRSMEVNPSHNFASALYPEKEQSFCRLRTRLEKLLIALIILIVAILFVIVIIMAINGHFNSKGKNTDCDVKTIGYYADKTSILSASNTTTKVCLTPGCVKTAQSASTEAAGTCCNGANDWPNKHQALVSQTASQKANIKAVFVGDSITEGWILTYDNDWGSTVWNQYYKPRGAYNYGISGDRTNNVLYRISHNEFDGLTPKVVVIMIGTNNIGVSSDDDVATAIKLIVTNLKAKMPSANYLLLGILPRNGAGTDQKVDNINKLISGTEGVTFLDMGSHFRTSIGNLNTTAYRSDMLHIGTKGYGLWHDVMEPTFSKLLG